MTSSNQKKMQQVQKHKKTRCRCVDMRIMRLSQGCTDRARSMHSGSSCDITKHRASICEHPALWPCIALLVNEHKYGKSPCSMGKRTISMAMFNSNVSHCQRVSSISSLLGIGMAVLFKLLDSCRISQGVCNEPWPMCIVHDTLWQVLKGCPTLCWVNGMEDKSSTACNTKTRHYNHGI